MRGTLDQHLCLTDLLDQDLTSYEYFHSLPREIQQKIIQQPSDLRRLLFIHVLFRKRTVLSGDGIGERKLVADVLLTVKISQLYKQILLPPLAETSKKAGQFFSFPVLLGQDFH